MQKTIFMVIFLWVGISILDAQDVIRLRAENTICSFNGELSASMQDAVISEWNDDTGLLPIIERIQTAGRIGSRNFTVLVTKTRINNAFATRIQGKDYIVVDMDFLKGVDANAGSKWCAISILAHEVGHHYYGHTVQGAQNNPHKNELESDYFSGFVLARLGASKEATIKAMNYMGTIEDTDSHPNKRRRMNSIINGWEAGQP